MSIGAFKNRFGEWCVPLPAAHTFKAGQVCRFTPPAGAYSLSSAQAHHAGKACQVVRIWNDSTVTVLFGGGITLPVNSAYLTKARP